MAIQSTEFPDKAGKTENRRGFPRIPAGCPVLYLMKGSKRWQVGILADFSATGMRFSGNDFIPDQTQLSFMLKPGSNRAIPEFKASGVVLRCNQLDDQKYEIACKITHVEKPTR